MIRRVHLFVVVVTVLMAVTASAQQQRVSWGDADHEVLIWNQRSNEPLFVKSRLQDRSNAGLGLIHRERGFTVSLLQPLAFSSTGGYFVWWVSLANQTGERMICFRREPDGKFHASGISAQLQDLGELKQIRIEGGSTYLFTAAGDGRLRLVSLTSVAQEHLFIDYDSSGQVERIRDEFSREATPQYDGEQLRRLTQIWVDHGNRYLTAAILK